jgi:beta-lactamase regulating signal transducer with metallopeptidase domain
MSALLDHLWQSTLLALVIGGLVLALRKAPAAVRHGLWLAASIKFLIPFAALAALGRLLAPRFQPLMLPAPLGLSPVHAAPAAALIRKAAQPLARFPFAPSSPLLQAPLSPAGAGPVTQALHQTPLHLDLLTILLALWALGCAAVLVRWMIRAARVHAMVRAARPVGWAAPMPVVASPSPIGPGLVGLWRPVLVMPQTLPEHLTRSEIDAIVAHEACHLRRYDNLTAALHALIEAVFWFHPLVWWIGTRLIAERELACDEAVLSAGHDRRAYARSLLESARLYVQSPLSCVAGASGVDLKTRVEKIMTAPLASPISRTKKALLLAAAACACATPVAAGLLTPEAQKAIAPLAKAMATLSAPARALGVDAAAAEPAKPVVLARNDVVLSPAVAVVATDAAPVALAQTVAAPRVDHAAAPAAAARPIEVASAAPPTPAARAIESADPGSEAASFVQTYAAATAKGAIARWIRPICVEVTGLPKEQAAAVKARIEAVATSVGVKITSYACYAPDIQVGFTNEAQSVVDQAFTTAPAIVGDSSSGAEPVKTMTLPIQAWYLTNGTDVAANGTGELKALADYRPDGSAGLKTLIQWYPGPGQPTQSSNLGIGNGASYSGGFGGYPGDYAPSLGPRVGPVVTDKSRQFLNAFVVVDAKRIPQAKLSSVEDYVAMLALSQSRSLGECQALPSIVDLFAACPGRAAPEGLTPADKAYLRALYGADHTIWAWGRPAVASDVAKAMAPRLADARVASR